MNQEKTMFFKCEKCDQEFANLADLQAHRQLCGVTANEQELQTLKAEILKEVNDGQQSQRRLRWGSIIVTGVLGILILFSVIQTVQSATILNKVNSGGGKASTTGSPSPAAPANVQDLPDMVGGC